MDLKRHQWAPYRQIWKIQNCAKKNSKIILSIRTETHNMGGKNTFSSSTSGIRRKSSQKKDILIHVFLPILQLHTEILYLLSIHIHIYAYVWYLACIFFIKQYTPPLKLCRLGVIKSKSYLCSFSTVLFWVFSPFLSLPCHVVFRWQMGLNTEEFLAVLWSFATHLYTVVKNGSRISVSFNQHYINYEMQQITRWVLPYQLWLEKDGQYNNLHE